MFFCLVWWSFSVCIKKQVAHTSCALLCLVVSCFNWVWLYFSPENKYLSGEKSKFGKTEKIKEKKKCSMAAIAINFRIWGFILLLILFLSCLGRSLLLLGAPSTEAQCLLLLAKSLLCMYFHWSFGSQFPFGAPYIFMGLLASNSPMTPMHFPLPPLYLEERAWVRRREGAERSSACIRHCGDSMVLSGWAYLLSLGFSAVIPQWLLYTSFGRVCKNQKELEEVVCEGEGCCRGRRSIRS